MTNLPYRTADGGFMLAVRLTPKGGRDAIDGIHVDGDGKAWLKVRVSAVPEGGKANAALEAVLAKALGVSRSNVSVIAGHTARNKQVAISAESVHIVSVLANFS